MENLRGKKTRRIFFFHIYNQTTDLLYTKEMICVWGGRGEESKIKIKKHKDQ